VNADLLHRHEDIQLNFQEQARQCCNAGTATLQGAEIEARASLLVSFGFTFAAGYRGCDMTKSIRW
jgi:hypothetical protein